MDDLVDLAYSFESALTGIEIVPLQKRSEIASLLRLLGDDPPENVLEIGTASGGTLFLFANVARPDARLISVDLPGGRFGGGYAWWRAGLYRSFVRSTQSLHLIRGDSHEQRILDRVQALLGGAKLDFLFIDGDHSYEGVERDFDMYRPLVRTGGIVAFHDIVPETPGSASSGPLRQAGGVPEFWRSVREEYRTMELVEDWGQGAFGIGVVRL